MEKEEREDVVDRILLLACDREVVCDGERKGGCQLSALRFFLFSSLHEFSCVDDLLCVPSLLLFLCICDNSSVPGES